MPFHRFSISVRTKSQTPRWAALLPMLEAVLPVKFHFLPDDNAEPGEELFTFDEDGAFPGAGTSPSSLGVANRVTGPNEEKLAELTVQFSDDLAVPFPYRGRTVRVQTAAQPMILSLKVEEVVLATCSLGPLWAFSNSGGARHFRSAFPLPVTPSGCGLQDVLNGYCFLEILPLIEWLRETCKSTSVGGLPLRACFIFDDPNLHWPTYGYVDYKQLALRARKENYHVSFATIPLDGWFAHRQTVEIFRENRSWLSLSVHGNNHTHHELGRVYSEAERSYLLYQAISRIEGLERRTGLPVSRVMIPPHGACSEQMLAALPLAGFEAACISHGSLRFHNKSSQWTNALGFLPSELVQGCPVLPRWPFSADHQNTILLAAYLNQAIVLRGHHQDLKNGLELLDQLARFINGLGSVSWLNMADLCRMNYQSRMAGTTYQLKPLGRKIRCVPPEGASSLLIESSFGGLPDRWILQGAESLAVEVSADESFPLTGPMKGGLTLEIVSPRQKPGPKSSPQTAAAAFVRRLLTEGRDRLVAMR
jgi:hypothetical protein